MIGLLKNQLVTQLSKQIKFNYLKLPRNSLMLGNLFNSQVCFIECLQLQKKSIVVILEAFFMSVKILIY